MKLTDEQIAELAPDWATHYYYHLGYIAFASEKLFCKYDLEIEVFSKESKMVCKISDLGGIEIKRKPFDISEHEFSDDKLSLLIDDADLISINDNCSGSCFDLHKDDAIAIAKHFKLTAEDLK